MMRSVLAKNFRMYNQVVMTDIELLELQWFRSSPYQDFVRFLEASDGFARHRWGGHVVRTLGVALFADDREVVSMALPYAHQDHCQCPDSDGGFGFCNDTAPTDGPWRLGLYQAEAPAEPAEQPAPGTYPSWSC